MAGWERISDCVENPLTSACALVPTAFKAETSPLGIYVIVFIGIVYFLVILMPFGFGKV